MALLFIDGFDHYATGDVLQKWSTGTITAVGSTFARTGAQGLSKPTTLKKQFSAAQAHATYVIGIATRRVNLSNDLSIIFYGDTGATTHVTVVFDASDGTIRAYRGAAATLLGTATTAIPFDSWCYVEVKATLSDSVGVITVRVNASGVLNLTNIDTKNAGTNTTFDAIALNHAGASVTFYVDDLYVLSASGAANNDFLGDVRVQTIYPSAAGNTTQLTPSTGNNWQCVDEVTPNTSDTVASAIDDQYDTYTMQDLPTTAGNIAGIQTGMYAAKSDTGAKSVTSVIRTGGTDYTNTDAALGTGYTYKFWIREVNPGTTVAWTPAEIDAMELGPKVRP